MKHFGKVYEKILKEIEEKKGLAFLVIDPADAELKDIPSMAKLAEETGFSAFAVGGSVGAQGEILDQTIKLLKENSKLPVILFPGNIASLSPHADAAYYMSLLNSRDPYYISGAQIAAAYPTKKMNLEVIPSSYIVFEPGRAVGWVGDAKLIPRDIPYIAGITALGGQYMGSHLVILESGSGAEEPAPVQSIAACRKLIEIPIVVAGGVRTPQLAYESIKAGADIVHIGTSINDVSGDKEKTKKLMKEMIEAVRKAGKERK